MSQRTERVAELIKKEISQILREDLQNPRIGFVTLLGVDVTADLRLARVHYSVYGTDEEKKSSEIEIRNSAKYIAHLVNERVNLRYAVELRFIRETAVEESFRIQEILDQIKREREAREGEATA
jgi:ribosome-binding factor A